MGNYILVRQGPDHIRTERKERHEKTSNEMKEIEEADFDVLVAGQDEITPSYFQVRLET
jgi:hypothetical protein